MGLVDDILLDQSALAELRGETIAQLRAGYLDSLSAGIEDSIREHPTELKKIDLADMPPLTFLVDSVARDFGLSPIELCSGNRGKRMTQAKLMFINKAREQGHLMREIAATLQCSPAAVTLLKKRKS